MNGYFYKLKAAFDVKEYSDASCRGDFFKAYGAISYYHMKVLSEDLKTLMISLWPNSIKWIVVKAGRNLPPHVDHGIRAALNIYVKPSGYSTNFWEQKEGAMPYTFPGEETSNLYQPSDLNPIGGFVALPGEVFLMNNLKVHTVEASGVPAHREFIQLNWTNRAFNDILTLIKSKENPL